MLDAAFELGMFVLLEAFDENDLARSTALLENPADHDRAAAGKLLVGVNTRNLRTLDLRFRPSLSGRGARDTDIGLQVLRLRPRRDPVAPMATIPCR